ncbi:MAG: hypothetical protein QG673_1470 [Pseudomonadota bacterium]|nr:hypothetical protein [Pseudomonadota bacterium]
MIILEPYNTAWPLLFEQEKILLLDATKEWEIIVEHIGSTAIPEIKAKPVIDIMIGVKDLTIADQYITKIIQSLGYDYISEYENNMPERRYFQKNNHNARTHQIHLVEYDSEFWLRHLLFRDYLRLHPNIAKEYESLKLDIAPKFTDSNQYAMAKNEFIRRIEKQAQL